jgi:hypothetical protein
MKAIFYDDDDKVIASWAFLGEETVDHGFDSHILEALIQEIKLSLERTKCLPETK